MLGLRRLNTAAVLLIRSSEKLRIISSRDIISVLSSSDQPSRARKLTSASGRKPWFNRYFALAGESDAMKVGATVEDTNEACARAP